MKQFNIKRFAELANAAANTDYYKNAGWYVDEIDDLIECSDDDEALDEYTDEDVLCMTESLAFANTTVPLPADVAVFVEYGYSLALEIEDATRINNYGILFYNARIGYQDFDKAAKYYKMASDLGFSLSTENLGYIYYYGRTGEVNYEIAYLLFSKASAGYNRACSTYKLGDMFKNGYYVNKDLKTAFQCYQRAESLIDNGLSENRASNVAADIFFRLAECYHFGIGVSADLDKSFEYYQKAERSFIVRIRHGDFLVKKMLIKTIERQDELREKLISELPKMEWARGNRGYLSL